MTCSQYVSEWNVDKVPTTSSRDVRLSRASLPHYLSISQIGRGHESPLYVLADHHHVVNDVIAANPKIWKQQRLFFFISKIQVTHPSSHAGRRDMVQQSLNDKNFFQMIHKAYIQNFYASHFFPYQMIHTPFLWLWYKYKSNCSYYARLVKEREHQKSTVVMLNALYLLSLCHSIKNLRFRFIDTAIKIIIIRNAYTYEYSKCDVCKFFR